MFYTNTRSPVKLGIVPSLYKPLGILRPPMKTAITAALLGLISLTFGACGGDSTQAGSTQPVDTGISIVTTDLESLPIGEGQQCVDLLSKIVDPDYIEEHGIEVKDRATAELAIENAITKVCDGGPPEQNAHEASHQVIDLVVTELESDQ